MKCLRKFYSDAPWCLFAKDGKMFFGDKDKFNIQIKENMTDKYNRFHMKIQKQVDK